MNNNGDLRKDGAIGHDVLIQEYSAVIQKMSANEAWAYSFVALYFAFLAAIGTATGYMFLHTSSVPGAEVQFSSVIASASVDLSQSRKWLVISLSVLGVFLNCWAISMIIDYKRHSNILLGQLAQIEKELHGNTANLRCFASQAISMNKGYWRIGERVVVGSVMALLFVPWLILIASAN